MKVKLIAAGGFGRLKNWHSPPMRQNLVVFYGLNESGKSTLFNLIATLFYGWNPASAQNNPYVPWDGTPAEVKATLETGDGMEMEILRRLRSRPEGTLLRGEKSYGLGNSALARVAFITRDIFTEVYALALDRLRFPAPGAWPELRDKLLGGAYPSFLRPLHTVLRELESEAAAYWRPDRRGKPRAKILQQELRDLYRRRRDAEENEAALRRAEERLAELAGELAGLQEEKIKKAAYIDRAGRLYPVVKKLHKMEELYRRAGEIEAFDHLPAEPEEYLADLEDKIAGLREEKNTLLAGKKRLQESIAACTAADTAVLALEDRIKSAARLSGQMRVDRRRRQELIEESERLQARLQERARDLLSGGWRPELAGQLERVDEAELRAALDTYKAARERRREESARCAGLEARLEERKYLRILPWAAAILFVLGAAGWLGAGSTLWGLIAGFLAAAGAGLALAWVLLKGSGAKAALEEAQKKLRELEAACSAARQSVIASLGGLPVAAGRLQDPDDTLLVDVNVLRDLLKDWRQARAGLAGVQERLEDNEKLVAELCQACALPYHPEDVEGSINRLEERLSAARDRSREAGRAKRELEQVRHKLAGLEESLARWEGKRRELLAALEGLPGDDLQEKFAELAARRWYRRQAQQLEEDLLKEYPDVDELREEIAKAGAAGEKWLFDDESVQRAKMEQEEIESRLQELKEEAGTLQNEVKFRREKPRLDDLEGAIAGLEEERQKVAAARDRLLLLRNIIAEADRRFREEHQPGVLQRAGQYLAAITGGRYTKLYVREEGNGALLVQGPGENHPREAAPPLSRGTLEQIYLALRLALADRLDDGNERLPLFWDEVLVNWDGVRLENGLRLLKEVASRRQVFLFTCHAWLAGLLMERAGAQLVELED